jgi:hypothetical protein
MISQKLNHFAFNNVNQRTLLSFETSIVCSNDTDSIEARRDSGPSINSTFCRTQNDFNEQDWKDDPRIPAQKSPDQALHLQSCFCTQFRPNRENRRIFSKNSKNTSLQSLAAATVVQISFIRCLNSRNAIFDEPNGTQQAIVEWMSKSCSARSIISCHRPRKHAFPSTSAEPGIQKDRREQ